LPWLRIEGAEIVRKIVFKVDPSAAHLGTRDLAGFGATAKLFGMAAKKLGGGDKSQAAHWLIPA
jgi:hypothetical protein